MEEKQIQELLAKYAEGKASEAEMALLESADLLESESHSGELTSDQIREDIAEVYARLPKPAVKLRLWPRIAGVAAAVAVLAVGVYFYRVDRKGLNVAENVVANDIAPGKQGATLTLADGKKIRLSDASTGELAKQAGVVVSKTADGQVVYTVAGDEQVDPSLSGEHVRNIRNVLSTGRGETYTVVLPDGTKVWLNAASSLIYNTNMKLSKQRVVSLEGEAYLEVAKDKLHPFVVMSGKQEVEVLGTHFNVSGYAEDGVIRTTLLEGSVRVSVGADRKVLRPGEQSGVSGSGKIAVEQVDVDDAVAWKNGYFQFEGESLEGIMRKVARWYDVEVVFVDQGLKGVAFVGTVSRYGKVSEVLKKLQMTNELDFRIVGRKILISSHGR